MSEVEGWGTWSGRAGPSRVGPLPGILAANGTKNREHYGTYLPQKSESIFWSVWPWFQELRTAQIFFRAFPR
jgi:hypothetical protein